MAGSKSVGPCLFLPIKSVTDKQTEPPATHSVSLTHVEHPAYSQHSLLSYTNGASSHQRSTAFLLHTWGIQPLAQHSFFSFTCEASASSAAQLLLLYMFSFIL